ncbi:MAG: hypothetical protein AAGF23_18875 [Acidobacteriota bacterium]
MTRSPKSISTPKTITSTAASVFDQDFLEYIADWPIDGFCENEAAFSGPWRVEELDGEFAVVRDGDERPRGTFKHHETACLVAAVLPAAGSDSLYAVRSCELLRVIGQAAPTIAGRFTFDDEDITGALHVAAWFLRSPHSLALLLEAASIDVLTTAGRLVAERRAVASGE